MTALRQAGNGLGLGIEGVLASSDGGRVFDVER